MGRLADAALLHIAAEGPARWLLSELDSADRGACRYSPALPAEAERTQYLLI